MVGPNPAFKIATILGRAAASAGWACWAAAVGSRSDVHLRRCFPVGDRIVGVPVLPRWRLARHMSAALWCVLAFSWALLLFAEAATALHERDIHRGDAEEFGEFLLRDIALDFSNQVIPVVLLIQFVDLESPMLNCHNKAFIWPTGERSCERYSAAFPSPRPWHPYPSGRIGCGCRGKATAG